MVLEGHRDNLLEGSCRLNLMKCERTKLKKKEDRPGPEVNWKEAEIGGGTAGSTSTPSRASISSKFSNSKPGIRRLRMASH